MPLLPIRSRNAITLAMVATAMFCSAQSTFVHTLMPQPAEIHAEDGKGIAIASGLSVSIDAPASEPLRSAADRMMVRLQNQTGVQFTTRLSSDKSASGIVLHVADVSSSRPVLGMNESYQIAINSNRALIDAPTLFGAYRGMETLLQLVQPTSTGFILPAVQIADAPRFAWRGLMLDSGRHFLPVSAVLRTIDGMASVKLNVLHLHLTEDQGFRIESKRFPKLHELGSNGDFYTQEEIRKIIAYAGARGIRVVPEFDIPGHSSSWMVGYPNLGSTTEPPKIEKVFGVLEGAMDPTRESTYVFLDAFLGEMASLFPDEYMHIGGDESGGKQWRANPAIVAFMKSHNMADTATLQTYFNKRVQALLVKHKKKMVGWDEILHPGLSAEVVVQNWHGEKFLIEGAKNGHQGVYSQPYYLDHNDSAAKMYLADPIPSNASLTPVEQKLILGGEACMWAEQVTDASVDSHIWPRTAAIAERFWSPQHIRDTNDMYRRLSVERFRLDALGLRNISGPERMVRQWYGGEPSQAVLTFTQALQPVDFGRRSHFQHNTTDTPMTSLADSLSFDPPMQHDFAVWMDAYLHGTEAAHAQSRQTLDALFHAWVDAGPALDSEIPMHPRLNEVASRRKELPKLGALGLQMMEAYEHKQKLSSSDANHAESFLSVVAVPSKELVAFVVIAPMQELLAATR